MKDAANYEFRGYRIPTRMAGGIQRWIDHGIMPGSFLRAVIENDLRNAIGNADAENLANLPAYVAYFYNEAPAACWGSVEKGGEWMKSKASN